MKSGNKDIDIIITLISKNNKELPVFPLLQFSKLYLSLHPQIIVPWCNWQHV